jgi:hypothetical protein
MDFKVDINYNPGGELEIKSDFTKPIELSHSGEEKIFKIDDIKDLLSLDKLSLQTTGIKNTIELEVQYRIATTEKPNKFSKWTTLNKNGQTECFKEVSPFHNYNIEIKFIRKGSSDIKILSVDSFSWEGKWDYNYIDSPEVELTKENSPVVFDVPDTFKVFNLEGYEIVSKNTSYLEVEYRYSQNNKRSFSEWYPLTTDNLKKEDIDPIRFFNIQYKFTIKNPDDNTSVSIRDLNLYGDFINVSKNYNKANLFGLREECKSGVIGNTDLNVAEGSNNLSMGQGLKQQPSLWENMEKNKEDLFNPYKLGEAVELYNKLSNDYVSIGGWEVEYFRTDPDENGTDHSIHEYSLYGVVDTDYLKILVPENQFPNGQVAFNQFDLALLESFEVHLTKEQFKQTFGNEFRPTKEDFLWFCDLSRMYRIENAQAIRDFANASVYYKLILGKYNQRANVRPTTSTIEEKVNDIVKNSTLEDLFGDKKEDNKERVALKDQHETLSKDNVRSDIVAPVEKELIDNAELVLSKYHYNLSRVEAGEVAVSYKKSDNFITPGENRSFISWFKFIEYVESDNYNLLNNYSEGLEKGYRFYIENGEIKAKFNDKHYSMDVSDILDEGIWYCVLININQKQRKINFNLFKRNSKREIDAKNLKSTKLKNLKTETKNYSPEEFEVDQEDIKMSVLASDIKITNIRIFEELVPEDQYTKTLNQQIIRDSDKLILADNANKLYKLPTYPYGPV